MCAACMHSLTLFSARSGDYGGFRGSGFLIWSCDGWRALRRFPIGGESISVTSGVVSRIEVTAYVHGSAELLGVQIDAAINSGNSGGPAFNARGQCVGIAFQSLKVWGGCPGSCRCRATAPHLLRLAAVVPVCAVSGSSVWLACG